MEECEKEPELKVCALQQLCFMTVSGTQCECFFFSLAAGCIMSPVMFVLLTEMKQQ